MRAVALIATYNERRFIGQSLEHLHAQGIESYLIDNCSTDDTVEIAERHIGRGLTGIEEFARDGVYNWHELLQRKEQVARDLEADWLIHLDADEVRLPSAGRLTLAEALVRSRSGGV
ncbi:MAG TPA: glycosyltransferase family A protein [Solirubrobacterales bacterium]